MLPKLGNLTRKHVSHLCKGIDITIMIFQENSTVMLHLTVICVGTMPRLVQEHLESVPSLCLISSVSNQVSNCHLIKYCMTNKNNATLKLHICFRGGGVRLRKKLLYHKFHKRNSVFYFFVEHGVLSYLAVTSYVAGLMKRSTCRRLAMYLSPPLPPLLRSELKSSSVPYVPNVTALPTV